MHNPHLANPHEIDRVIQGVRNSDEISNGLKVVHNSLEIVKIEKDRLDSLLADTSSTLEPYQGQGIAIPTHEYFYPGKKGYSRSRQSDDCIPIDLRGVYDRVTLFDERENVFNKRDIGRNPVRICVRLLSSLVIDENCHFLVPVDQVDGPIRATAGEPTQ